MSVFNDFQRLWMERFPDSVLSDSWEQDVRASLERHRQKIAAITKELEQETLYVEYLERLLSDVEKFRECGGDPATIFQGSPNQDQITAVGDSSDHDNADDISDHGDYNDVGVGFGFEADRDGDGDGDVNADVEQQDRTLAQKTSLELRESKKGTEKQEKCNRLSLKIGKMEKRASNNIAKRKTISDLESKEFSTEDNEEKREKHGALQQCITELAETIGNANANANVNANANAAVFSKEQQQKRQQQQQGKRDERQRKPTSHFVTVIEVKETKAATTNIGGMTNEAAIDHHDANDPLIGSGATFTSFERKSAKIESSAPPPLSPLMSASSYAAHLDAKKKMPPRPPPKNIRRVEPPTIPGGAGSGNGNGNGSNLLTYSPKLGNSPVSSLERNVKPSDILRQKSTELIGNTPELIEELGRQIIEKSESLEKRKRNNIGTSTTTTTKTTTTSIATTGSLGRLTSTNATNSIGLALAPGGRKVGGNIGQSPTGSLNKGNKQVAAFEGSSNDSLEKKSRPSLPMIETESSSNTQQQQQQHISVGSKESLASQAVSEIVQSYESVSSLSSDSAKMAQHADNEPYYDSVPLDNGEGEYVYIKPGRTGSSSSRDDLSTPGSTLPISLVTQLSSQGNVNLNDPESPVRSSNYVNIDYFLNQGNETRSSSLDSDGECDSPPIMRTISRDEHTAQTPDVLRKNLVSAILVSGNARGAKIRSILSTIIQSETIYVECLNKMLQYKRAIHATLNTSQPVIKKDEEQAIFFKIDELHEVHTEFLTDLKTTVAHEGGDVLIGETFKRLADMFDLYSAFLHNYCQAIDTVKKCSANNPQFKKIVSTIVVNLQTEQSLTLEDLLHKPVARVQKNALVFDDLLSETPPNHPDHFPLRQAQKIIQMFLKQLNVVDQRLPGESNRNLRRMVKNSFIVELVDGHRKLRHLFLFNDVIACAKYKASGRDRIDYELKWFIPLKDIIVYEETDANADLKESCPANILQLKTQACTVRDQLLSEERDEKAARKANGVRSCDKYRRKLADLESQLVLASPNLVFRIGNKATNKTLTFFLSSDYERTHWIDSIISLKQNCNLPPGGNTINALDVTAFIVALQKGMKTEMGSYLMRNTNDESLLIGDLHITVLGLLGMEQPVDLYVCIEVDSYGHYFRKATTKMICRSANPIWNESFVVELEGSQNVRILLYEAHDRPLLRAKHVLKLSRSWLTQTAQTHIIRLNDKLELNTTLRFVPGEVTNRRVPTSKPGALFGAKISQVLKREKRDIPFIISACVHEVERRGMREVGIYRISGSSSDLAKLKKSFETNPYEAEQLLKDVDIHSVAGILKSYLRELPEALFTDVLYPKFFETFRVYSNNDEIARIVELLKVFEELPQVNKASINHLLDHFISVHKMEADNKMSLHNLAMVFGPTLLRPGQTQVKQKDPLAASTVDVMAQAGILYCFLQARIANDTN